MKLDTTLARKLFRHVWDALVLVVVLLVAFAIPLRIVLAPGMQPLSPLGDGDGLLTVLFGIDLIIRLRSNLAGGRRRAAWWWLGVDLIAALPLGSLSGVPALHLTRLLKLTCVFSTVRGWRRSMLIHPTVMRLVSFVVWLSLLAHWLACGWIHLDGPTADLGTSSGYLSALYWCVTTLTTVGYGDVTPTSVNQTIYTMVVMLLGVGVYGFVIGNVANLLTKMDMARAQYVATIERVTGFLRYRLVPAPLQREIYAYYKYLWENRMGYDESMVLDELPPSLRGELSLVLTRGLIEKIDFLRGASPELIQDLCVKLRPVVFTPGDIVVRAGEVGNHVYFISRGTVEVISPDGNTVFRRLSDGDFFGELALLHTERRTATVKAVGYCDFYVLDKETFAATIQRYPEFAKSIREISEARTQSQEPSDAALNGSSSEA